MYIMIPYKSLFLILEKYYKYNNSDDKIRIKKPVMHLRRKKLKAPTTKQYNAVFAVLKISVQNCFHSGLMKKAERANMMNTTPPIKVTVRTEI